MKVIMEQVGSGEKIMDSRDEIYKELLQKEFAKINLDKLAKAFLECQTTLKFLK